jgi:hypothetical protein
MLELPDGLVAVVKRECPTCSLIAPVLKRLAEARVPITVCSQDDPAFPPAVPGVVDDRSLEISFRAGIEIVPTLLRVEGGREAARVFGWNRDEWRSFTGVDDLGAGLPENRPGCGSKTMDPGMSAKLAVRFGAASFSSRIISVPAQADPAEWCYEQGWTDGLPVVPPTEERVYAMLQGTRRDAQDVVGLIPPNFAACTVEKVAINAVMAGCKPEYLPVVLTAIEAALIPQFGLHGILATTNAVAPVVMVNGPIARAIGMNASGNALGQGNRANAAIGRTLQLVVRNVGGGRPGEIDRAVFGNPGKYTFCFAEDESDPRWDSFAVERGFAKGASTVTLFPGDGVNPVIDHISRRPEDLVQTYAGCLRALYNPGQVNDVAAFLVIAGEHAAVFYEAGWSKQRLKDELRARLMLRLDEVVEGRSGKLQMSAEELADPRASVPKFRTGSLNIVRAGGSAGKYSAIISGLGSKGINPVTKEIAA